MCFEHDDEGQSKRSEVAVAGRLVAREAVVVTGRIGPQTERLRELIDFDPGLTHFVAADAGEDGHDLDGVTEGRVLPCTDDDVGVFLDARGQQANDLVRFASRVM